MAENGLAGRAELLRKAERRYVEVEVEGLGRVRLRSLSEREQGDYDTAVISARGKFDRRRAAAQRRRLIALCLVDEHNERLFTDAEADAIGELDGRIADQIYTACVEHCGTETVEEAEKN